MTYRQVVSKKWRGVDRLDSDGLVSVRFDVDIDRIDQDKSDRLHERCSFTCVVVRALAVLGCFFFSWFPVLLLCTLVCAHWLMCEARDAARLVKSSEEKKRFVNNL